MSTRNSGIVPRMKWRRWDMSGTAEAGLRQLHLGKSPFHVGRHPFGARPASVQISPTALPELNVRA